jgi:fructose-bisphosphate aldolase, class II
MKQTWGVPVEEIQRGIKHGVRKINVDTDNRMAITGAIRKVLWELWPAPKSSTRATYLKPARDAAMKQVCVAPHGRLRPGGRTPARCVPSRKGWAASY